MAGKKRIVFVSDKNSCRSIIAQAHALHLGFDKVDAQSFGLEPNRVHYLVAEVLREKGIDMNFFFSKAWEVVEHQRFDIFVAMNPSVKEELPAISYDYQVIEWNFEDPTRKQISEEEMKKEIEKLSGEIEQRVKELIEGLN
ncbi:MAG: hypothetical protein P8184_16670 [Calditrichia bacterium]